MSAAASNVTIATSATKESYLGTPSWTICPSASGSTCKIASLPVGTVYELLTSVPVGASAPEAARIVFTASVSASGASSYSASATDVVVAPGAVAANSSTLSGSTPPLLSLPSLPGTSVSAVNPSDLFPTVSPTPSSSSLGLPAVSKSGHVVPVADVSSTVPIDARLLGGQLVGLAVLAGAVTIAITRLSLRRSLPLPAQPAQPTQAAQPPEPTLSAEDH